MIDNQCKSLCEAMNRVAGIHTTSSCCGHGKNHFRIWFTADNLINLPPLLYYFDACHCGFHDWDCEVYTDCAKSPATFLIRGPISEQAYEEANEIAKLLNKSNIKE